ncbi:MAG TPA: sulfatase, partial [Polyangiaceae bacterium]
MTNAVRRIVFAIAGGAGAAALVSLVEAGAAAGGSEVRGASYRALVLADLAVLVPVALVVGSLVALLAIFLEPSRSKTPAEHFARQRSKPVLQRARDAALAPLVLFGGLLWCVTLAHAARAVLAEGAPLGAGAALAVIALGAALVVALGVLALVRPLRRALAWGAQAVPALLDPVTTASLSAAAVALTIAWGIHVGDNGGDGGTLGIFGVLKRAELDLRPLINLLALALGAYLAQVAFGRRRTFAPVAVAAVLVLVSGVVTVHEARALNQEPATARAVARDAPLGKIALGALRRVTDRDRDGVSP